MKSSFLLKTFLPVFAAIVIVAGIAYAVWTEPTATPPGDNVAAPINVGPGKQVKVGTATQKADICVDPYGVGDEKCLSELVGFPKCTLAGGVPTTAGTVTVCKFPGGSCPSGWTQYLNYTETTANTCTGGGSCGTSVTSGSHAFANIDPATEARTYYDGNQTAYSCNPVCVNNCCCSCGFGPCGSDCRCCCGWSYSTCYTSCSSTAKTCNSTVAATGCVTN